MNVKKFFKSTDNSLKSQNQVNKKASIRFRQNLIGGPDRIRTNDSGDAFPFMRSYNFLDCKPA